MEPADVKITRKQRKLQEMKLDLDIKQSAVSSQQSANIKQSGNRISRNYKEK